MIPFFNKQELIDYFHYFDTLKNKVESPFIALEYTYGKCDYCNTIKKFANKKPDGNEWINRRDQYLCETCGLSSRLRSFFNSLKAFYKGNDSQNLIFEKSTPFYQLLAKKFEAFLGTEYFEDVPLGKEVDFKGITIRNENIMQSTFKENFFDIVAHQEVLEHVPYPEAALADNYRILKPDGFLIFTAPFYHNLEKTIINAVVKDGEVIHLREPVYHGNPLSNEGSLVFQIFGQDFLDHFFSIGFRKAWIEFDFDTTRSILSCGNPYPVGQMYPIIFIGYK